MLGVLKRLCRLTVAFVRRVITAKPINEYERIVFDALYAVGAVARKGLA